MFNLARHYFFFLVTCYFLKRHQLVTCYKNDYYRHVTKTKFFVVFIGAIVVSTTREMNKLYHIFRLLVLGSINVVLKPKQRCSSIKKEPM